MLKGIHVFDDIISLEKQNLLESYFTTHPNFEYGNNLHNLKGIDDTIIFPQWVLPKRKSDTFPNNINTILYEISSNTLDKLGLSQAINWRTKINKIIHSDTPHHNQDYAIHIDREEEHLSLVYYINNSDGDTVFYELNDTYGIDDWEYVIRSNQFDSFKKIKTSPPKKGRVVIFDGKTPHRSTYPSNGDRYVLNMNFNYNNKENKKLF